MHVLRWGEAGHCAFLGANKTSITHMGDSAQLRSKSSHAPAPAALQLFESAEQHGALISTICRARRRVRSRARPVRLARKGDGCARMQLTAVGSASATASTTPGSGNSEAISTARKLMPQKMLNKLSTLFSSSRTRLRPTAPPAAQNRSAAVPGVHGPSQVIKDELCQVRLRGNKCLCKFCRTLTRSLVFLS